uniref:PRELI/MSF1 domain-containing protein n=2 Tax=Bursaphelenchus xylophilus TaxID=6326 RepID=A0A1I7RPS1_BURXY
MCLPTSEEMPKNVSHYMIGSIKLRADKVFVSNCPIYNVYYEVRRPSVTVEKIHNPRLKQASDFYLKNTAKCVAEFMKVEWKHLKMVTAQGSHQAVERVIVTGKEYKLKRIRPIRFIAETCSVNQTKPTVKIENVKRLRRPQKDVIQLRSVNTSQEPRKIKLIHQDEDVIDQFAYLNLSVSTHSTYK